MIPRKIQSLLNKVEKPARYLGNELNSVHKAVAPDTLRFAWCFPDLYEIGMSHLGSLIMYHLLNDQERVFCERCYAPADDMSQYLEQESVPLFTLETKTPLREFHFVGFTLQYELSYTTILHMLSLAHVPLLSHDRTDDDPIVIMGGPCAYNPEPVADFADIIVIGEGEEVILDIITCFESSGRNKQLFLKKAASVEGCYVPSMNDGSATVRKRHVEDFDQSYFPKKPLVPFLDVVHDRATLELFRGCIRGCRFCQAGIIYRPVRRKEITTLMDQASHIIPSTGYDEISLTSLSTSDYPGLKELTRQIDDTFSHQRIGISLPSLRLDNTTLEIMQDIQKVRKSGLTFAPEAGSQRLRNVINKGLSEADLVTAVTNAYMAGWSQIKLYFMIGLPTETMEDVNEIFQLVSRLDQQVYRQRSNDLSHPLRLSVSVSNFVPKPWTPFQWVTQDTLDTFRKKHIFLKDLFRTMRAVQFSYHDPETSLLEGIFARGDRNLSQVLLRAHQKGCRLDGWAEHFHWTKWMESFKECDIDPAAYLERERGLDEALPWDHLQPGVTKEFLIREYQKALQGETTEHCLSSCSGCGFQGTASGGICP